MKKPKLDLSRHLKKKRRQKFIKPILTLILSGLLISLLPHIPSLLPWHWQLFLRWLTHGGNVTEIPEHLHRELSELCYTADASHSVDASGASDEIAYSLGKFKCTRSLYENRLFIHDIYEFNSFSEARAGSPVAVLLVKLVGTKYSYSIDDSIPISGVSSSSNW